MNTITTDAKSSSNKSVTVLPVKPDNIPQLLRSLPIWVVWKVGEIREDGRYEKLPSSPVTGAAKGWPQNLGTFDQAWTRYQSYPRTETKPNGWAGIGIAITPALGPVRDGLYLVGIDLDKCISRVEGNVTFSAESQEVRQTLNGSIYSEFSPSGTGLRMFGLYQKKLVGGNEDGKEMYCDTGGRFLTVTGWGQGQPEAMPPAIEALEKRWFGEAKKAKDSGESQTAFNDAPTGPIAPYPIDRNGEDFYSALCAAYPNPEGYDEWFKGCCSLAYLEKAQGWPKAKVIKVRKAWAKRAVGANMANNDDLWDALLDSTKKRLSSGEKVTTHLSILKVARNKGWEPDTPDADPVRNEIQQQFALIVLKKLGIIDRSALAVRKDDGMAEPLTILPRGDGALLIRRLVRAKFLDDPFEKERSGSFMVHQHTTCYEGVEFNPRDTTPGFLNLWIGPTVTAMKGEWPLIREFLLVIICSNSQAAFDYLIRYIAHALQRPWEKPGTMIAMVGGEGIGKGTLARIIRKIWTATFLHTHTIKPIVGDFNGALERTFWVFLDEAIFAGDKAGTNALKALITEPTIFINEKNQPGRTIRSYHRFIAATNYDHFKHVDPDNRRDFMLRVSETRKGDKEYWDALSGAIEGGEVSAMAYDLMNLDLTGFDIRTKPNTKELTQQKLQSLDAFHLWWYDCLTRGGIASGVEEWPEFISTHLLQVNFKSATHGLRTFKQVTDRDIRDWMRKLCPSAKKEQATEGRDRRRGFKLPILGKCREGFEKYIGDTVEWE